MNGAKRLIGKLWRGERGAGPLIILLVIAIIGMLAGGYYVFQNELQKVEEPPVFLPGEIEYRHPDSFGCNKATDYGNFCNGDPGARFIAPYSMEITSAEYRCGRGVSGSGQSYIRIYYANGGSLGALLGSSVVKQYMDLPSSNYPGLEPWAEYAFNPGVYLVEGISYYIVSDRIPPCTDIFYNSHCSASCCGSPTQGSWYGAVFYSGYSNDYWISGLTETSPVVTTVGHIVEDNGTITLEGWSDVLGQMQCGFYSSTDETDVDGGKGANLKSGTSPHGIGRFYFDYNIVKVQTDVTYYYRAYSKIGGGVWYGSVLSFSRNASSIPLTISCDAVENSIDRVAFSTSIIGTHSPTSYNVSINYAQSIVDLQSGNVTDIPVTTNFSTDSTFRTYNNDFTPGELYYYRAKVVGNDSSISYSLTSTLLRYDASQPWFINWMGGIVNKDLSFIWWVIAGCLFAGAWILAATTGWWWLGIILSVAILAGLVVFDMVGPWLVVLLAIIAGWIIFKVVFKKAGAGGSS